MVDVPAPACPGHHCLRFLARRDGHVPTALCVRGDRAPQPTSDPLQRHHPSKRRMDAATAARDHRVERRYDYLLHDRDSIFSQHLDESAKKLGIRVLKSPPRSPMANAICERVIGTIRRECLDWLIPLSESHLRSILKSWIYHYNTGRPHMALGPSVPDPPPACRDYQKTSSRHRHGESYAVRANPILGGLHHEYSLAPSCA